MLAFIRVTISSKVSIDGAILSLSSQKVTKFDLKLPNKYYDWGTQET